MLRSSARSVLARAAFVGAAFAVPALVAVSCASPGVISRATPTTGADTVITGARVWTGNPQQPWATAVAVRDDVIVAVGSDDDVARLIGSNTKVLALPGRLVLPGLHDAHVHPLGAGRQELGCPVQDLKSVDAVLAKIKSCADASNARGGFVFGRGWHLALFAQGNPHRTVLDAVVADRPAYFRGEDGHSGWANTKALQLAGITAATKDPAYGVIERDADGTPSGTLRESAIDLIEALLPEPTLEDDVVAMRLALRHLSENGITSIMDAGVDERRLQAFAVLAERGELTVRVVACIVVDPTSPAKAIADAKALRTRFNGPGLLKVTATKIYLDGVLEGETAALLAPYHDHPEHKGTLNAKVEDLDALVAGLEGEGFQVHMHVIGDAAARAALNAWERAHKMNGANDLRGTLAHLQLVDAADHARFKQLGVVVNAQSYWAYPDTYITDINLPQVGAERVNRMYPWASLQRAGAVIVGGSDWPVTTLNPFFAIEVMRTRADPERDDADAPVLNANEALDLDTALRAYTTSAAFLLHQEALTGALVVGKQADLVVVDQDFTVADPKTISDAKVELTMLAGKLVYRAP